MGATGFQISFEDPYPVFDPAYLDGLIDLASIHQDFYGIPWLEFASGDPLPSAWLEKMSALKNFADELGFPVFLSITPLDSSTRANLAPLAQNDGNGNLVLTYDWTSTCINPATDPLGETVKAAYKNYALWMVDFFEPKFANIGTEINLFYHFCGNEPFSGMIDIVNAAYDSIKDAHADLPVLVSFQIDMLWDYEDDACQPDPIPCLEANLAVMEPIKRDLFGISTYPLGFKNTIGYVPEEHFSGIAERVSEPLAIAETGYNSGSVIIETPHGSDNCVTYLTSSHDEQLGYLKFLLTEAKRLNMPFVIWWSIRDYLPKALEASCPCPEDLEPMWCLAMNSFDFETELMLRFFGHVGAIYNDGSEKEAHSLWKEWLRKPLD